MRYFIILLAVLLTACESNPPAPIIDRAPETKPKPPLSKPAANKLPVAKEWRPDSHIVKKGDTLFGIGLEYGVDYKEIAAANNIAPPYPIKIGQAIDLKSFKTKVTSPTEVGKTETSNTNTEDGVVITPMKTDPDIVAGKPIADKPIASVVTPVLSEPKAIREPYSLEALNRAPSKTIAANTTATKPSEAKPTETKPTETKPAETKPTETKPADTTATGDEAINWAWPTQGKVTAGFNEATNKGIDIGGETGQAIKAASAGKVIYSGSDLRGYGKLVIVKHNKTYLSVYAHNSKIVVKEGQSVVAGQKIAEMGNTDSNSTKLHFEIRRLGKSVDPAKYLNQN
jgi:lipoprotein NlpD